MIPAIHYHPFRYAVNAGVLARTRDGYGFPVLVEQHAPRVSGRRVQLAVVEQQSPYSDECEADRRNRQRQPIAVPQDDIARWTPDRPGTFRTSEPHRRGRLTGPVVFVRGLLESWKLDRGAAVFLLGFERAESEHVERILNGAEPLVGRDTKDRIVYLYRIRSALSALFRNEDVESEWLREKHTLLGDRIPLDLLREGSMENLLLVKEYVDVVAGR